MPELLKLFHKIQTERAVPNLLSEATILQYLHHIKNQQRKNYKPISLMSIDAQMLNTNLQAMCKNIKNITHHDQVGFIPEMQG